MNKQMSMVAIALSVLLVGLGGLLVGRYLLAPKSSSDIALLLDEKTRELDDRTKQIQDLEKETAQLRQDLEETAKQVGGLQDRLDQANRGVASIQDRLKSRSRSSQSARDTSTSGTGGRPDEAGKYEIIRSTSVFEEASAGARKVATIEK